MSASQCGNMRGLQVKTPLLLLLLLAALIGTVLPQEIETQTDYTGPSGDAEVAEAVLLVANSTLAPNVSTTAHPVVKNIKEERGSGPRRNVRIQTNISKTTESPSFTDTAPTESTVDGGDGLDLIVILIPAVLVAVIICIIVCCIFINRRLNKKTKDDELRKEDPHLDESSTEKVPMPMFEEDVPSVLELEMEELDQWMKKDDETTEDSKHV